MNTQTAITLGITIAGFIGGVIISVARLAIKTGRLMERLEQNEARDGEEREKIGMNFTELYGRMNAAECELKSQGTAIKSIEATCARIETKLDRIIERG
jgi:hypothetical protein